MLKKAKEIRTLVIRVAIISGLALGVYFLWQIYQEYSGTREVEIEETPIRIEQIRSILELNSIRFQDEVVVDTVEYYENTGEILSGQMEKMFNWDQLKNSILPDGVKRRLTIIARGDLLIGIDLKDKSFKISKRKDSILVTLPNPKVLQISINPKGIDIFTEVGDWKDFERTYLIQKAERKMRLTAEQLHLIRRSKEGILYSMKQLIQSKKKTVFKFAK